MPKTITTDGENWYEVSDDEFQKLLEDSEADCWVDFFDDGTFICTLDVIRKANTNAEEIKVNNWGMPATLYGLPIVYETDR